MISPKTRAWMEKLANRRDYKDGELVHARGDFKPSLDVIVSGAVKLTRLRHDGSISFVTTMGPGYHFADVNLMAGTPRTHTVYAVRPTAIDHYDRAAFDTLLENHDVLLALYRLTGIRLGAAISMVDDLRTLSRDAHLGKLLMTLSRGDKCDGKIEVVQEDLAAILGVSVMTLAKSIGRLKRDGLIETGYRQVRVTNRDRLRQWLAKQEPD
jgi:CRP-like cAMP-binding protein